MTSLILRLAKLPWLCWVVVGLVVALLCLFGLWRHAKDVIALTKAALAQEKHVAQAAKASAERERSVQDETRKVQDVLVQKRAATDATHDAVQDDLAMQKAEVQAAPVPRTAAEVALELNRTRGAP